MALFLQVIQHDWHFLAFADCIRLIAPIILLGVLFATLPLQLETWPFRRALCLWKRVVIRLLRFRLLVNQILDHCKLVSLHPFGTFFEAVYR